ncbi:glutamate--cysteine ligase [Rhodothalassium salexigens]|uniref:Glutamate--cysteine ligase n=1 Tax=Rhodothalassium salexigens DSM 2132 TaxID=1188247 RepID=A0A4R2PH19_RHOSA|nr:glutamate--cysteine ligase [Rhodothalassium salexigens]MBB4211965.1 glutamate--cysteine ligase [Rhodothalassium salexigens DSM 2132]MBK1638627.1 glutamate--cysteine ligase [Rhodothalassium salexigens DSM 2132]MBK5911181.1 glutamate--cysteine ligase [Rhodothalassium salexigens]MBK5921929.1 glutamate--cysteine ligase [Rhodothalassium salexigens]TCP33451.1 glutamate--cysteine ligase [Rhodothalassium salexigens DSM 2132]
MADDPRPHLTRADLIASLEQGCKAPADFRIGAEHEKFVYNRADRTPLAYDSDPGIRDVLDGFRRFGWEPVHEAGQIVALKQDGASITLEPGGQLELSGAPLETIHEICNEVTGHLRQARDVGHDLGVGFLGLGFHPTLRRDQMPWMPKQRYRIMRAYMPTRGKLGHDMMTRTCTVQVNLDFASEADMVKKFRVALALQPVATALFANSPFVEGKPNGIKSNRSWVWTDTDPDRTGMLPFVFDDGFGFERWVDYVLDVPMYFVQRDGAMIDLAGQSFRTFMDGRLDALPGERPSMADWMDHLTTPFPEVRLKTFLEMRGADGGPWSWLCALPALWVGLLYDDSALDAAWDLVRDWSAEERQQLRLDAAIHALDAPWRGGRMADLAREVLAIADAGLKARARAADGAPSEQAFLDSLHETVASGKAPADRLLDLYERAWNGDVTQVFDAFSY